MQKHSNGHASLPHALTPSLALTKDRHSSTFLLHSLYLRRNIWLRHLLTYVCWSETMLGSEAPFPSWRRLKVGLEFMQDTNPLMCELEKQKAVASRWSYNLQLVCGKRQVFWGVAVLLCLLWVVFQKRRGRKWKSAVCCCNFLFFFICVNVLGLLLTALLLAMSSKNNVCLQAGSEIPRDGNNSSFTSSAGSTSTCFSGKSSFRDVT